MNEKQQLEATSTATFIMFKEDIKDTDKRQCASIPSIPSRW